MNRDKIREIFMAHGFTIKEGQADLRPYVYEAAEALLAASPSTPALAQGDEPVACVEAGTGNAEADRIIGRLASSDPDFDDCADAVGLICRLVAEHKGPDGFATWKDAAIHERQRSAILARQLSEAQEPEAGPGVDVEALLSEEDAFVFIFPSALELCQEQETKVSAFSVPMGSADGLTVPLYTAEQVRHALARQLSEAQVPDARLDAYAQAAHWWAEASEQELVDANDTRKAARIRMIDAEEALLQRGYEFRATLPAQPQEQSK